MNKYQNKLNLVVLPFLVSALSFSLFLGTAVFSIFITLTILLWLVSGEWTIKFAAMKNNPVVISALLLFGVIALGLFWSHVPWEEKFPMFMKYHRLLYIPMIVSILQTDLQRRHAINAFLVVSIGILFISYGKFLGMLPFHDEGMGYVVTRNRISHSIFMSFAAFLMLHRMVAHHGIYRYVWGCLGALAVANVMFLVNGRTGQLIVMTLIALFVWQQLGAKSIGYFIVTAILAVIALKTVPAIQHSRLLAVGQEINDANSSSGLRMGFYKNSIELVKKHPVLGVGTGAFKSEYAKQVEENKEIQATANPHNQYLLIAIETGLVGLFAFLFFLLSGWRSAAYLGAQEGDVVQGLVLLFALGSAFNSLLFDAGEGRFYCTLLAVIVSQLHFKKT